MWPRKRAIAPASVASFLLALLSGSAGAVDGVLEINQACATNTGCFAGDGPGFPVEINASGSYRLTGDLVVAAGGVQGIRVFTDGVSIDLNGFTLQGPVTCTGSGASIDCGSPAVARGINAATFQRVRVRNGRVRGFGSDGIATGERARIRDVVVESNAGDGLNIAQLAVITGSVARGNGGIGIFARPGSVVTQCAADSNGDTGISVGASSTLEAVTARGNGGIGVLLASSAAGRSITSSNNGAEGVNLGAGSVLADSTIRGNARGILSASYGIIHGNVITVNSLAGIESFIGTGYRENNIHDNAGGTVLGGASVVDMGGNSCDGSTTCP